MALSRLFRYMFPAVVAVLAWVFFAGEVSAEETVKKSGWISGQESWSGGSFELTGDVFLASSAVLRIENGASLELNGFDIRAGDDGQLYFDGSNGRVSVTNRHDSLSSYIGNLDTVDSGGDYERVYINATEFYTSTAGLMIAARTIKDSSFDSNRGQGWMSVYSYNAQSSQFGDYVSLQTLDSVWNSEFGYYSYKSIGGNFTSNDVPTDEYGPHAVMAFPNLRPTTRVTNNRTTLGLGLRASLASYAWTGSRYEKRDITFTEQQNLDDFSGLYPYIGSTVTVNGDVDLGDATLYPFWLGDPCDEKCYLDVLFNNGSSLNLGWLVRSSARGAPASSAEGSPFTLTTTGIRSSQVFLINDTGAASGVMSSPASGPVDVTDTSFIRTGGDGRVTSPVRVRESDIHVYGEEDLVIADAYDAQLDLFAEPGSKQGSGAGVSLDVKDRASGLTVTNHGALMDQVSWGSGDNTMVFREPGIFSAQDSPVTPEEESVGAGPAEALRNNPYDGPYRVLKPTGEFTGSDGLTVQVEEGMTIQMDGEVFPEGSGWFGETGQPGAVVVTESSFKRYWDLQGGLLKMTTNSQGASAAGGSSYPEVHLQTPRAELIQGYTGVLPLVINRTGGQSQVTLNFTLPGGGGVRFEERLLPKACAVTSDSLTIECSVDNTSTGTSRWELPITVNKGTGPGIRNLGFLRPKVYTQFTVSGSSEYLSFPAKFGGTYPDELTVTFGAEATSAPASAVQALFEVQYGTAGSPWVDPASKPLFTQRKEISGTSSVSFTSPELPSLVGLYAVKVTFVDELGDYVHEEGVLYSCVDDTTCMG